MRIQLATLCLNELEWLPRLYEQHKDWPGLVNWTFVESADRLFAEVNPSRVSPSGLSVDGTSEFLRDLAARDSRVTYIPYGFCGGSDHPLRRDQGKCEARQQYLDVAEGVKPELIIVLDADEFYSHTDQGGILRIHQQFPNHRAYLFPQRHLWAPPSVHSTVMPEVEAVGGYWSIPHYRVWRWERGIRYRMNHNWPEDIGGTYLKQYSIRFDGGERRSRRILRTRDPGVIPQCVHMGYASSLASREAKHAYYVARGEGIDTKRSMYVDCRTAFETWTPGDALPHGATVVPYTGPYPEVFSEQRSRRPHELLPTPEHAAGHPGLA